MAASSIREDLDSMIQSLNSVASDATKAGEGNKAAGTRVRTALSDVGNRCKELRKKILESRDK